MLVAWLVVGCAGEKDHGTVGDDVPEPTPTGSTGSTGLPDATGATGDTADVVPPPLWPDDCDPHVRVPVFGGEFDPLVLPDPHDEVYGATPTPFGVRYGWPGSDPSVSASFLWRTDVATMASVVELERAGQAPVVHQGASFTFGTDLEGNPLYRTHEVRLCQQLEPGTAYRYRVGGPGGWSPQYTFTTPRPPGTFDTVRVVVAGDSRGSMGEWSALVAAAMTHEPDFVLFTGDAVGSGANQLEWDFWNTAAGDALATTAFVAAHGNHEGLALQWFGQVGLPNNELWYTIRIGPLELAVLNDSSLAPDDRTIQAAWLADRLGASAAPWKIAAHHQSAYATNTRHGSNLDLRAEWAPIFDEVGMDLVFNGHNHTYERSDPIRGDAPASAAAGVTYVITGGAGAPLYANTLPDWFSEVANPIEHYLVVDFGPAGAHAVARDLAGNVIDDFTVPAD